MARIVVKLNPDKSETDAVLAGIIAAAKDDMPQGDGLQPVGFFVDDPANGQSAGGLTGYALFDWLYVEFLHVAPTLRGAGVGRELMNAAEAWARERGLVGIWLQNPRVPGSAVLREARIFRVRHNRGQPGRLQALFSTQGLRNAGQLRTA